MGHGARAGAVRILPVKSRIQRDLRRERRRLDRITRHNNRRAQRAAKAARRGKGVV
jgi:hypothetical protein